MMEDHYSNGQLRVDEGHQKRPVRRCGQPEKMSEEQSDIMYW